MPGAIREAFLAAAALALATILFVSPWRPNERTVLAVPNPAMEAICAAEVSIVAHAYRQGARNLASILSGGDREWFDAPYLRPIPTPLAMWDHRLFEGVLAAPLFLRLDALVAFGWLVGISLWVTSLAAYALGRYLTGSPWGGAACALLFGFGLYRANGILYPHGLFVPSLPLWLLAFVAFVDRPGSGRGAALAAVSAGLALELVYHALHVAFFLPVLAAFAAARRKVSPRAAAGVLAATALLMAAGLAPIAGAYQRFHEATALERAEADVEANSAEVLSWVTAPGGRLFIAGGPSVERLARHPIGHFFPGMACLVLAAAGARSLGRRSPEAWLLAALSVWLSFGIGGRLLWSLGLPRIPIGPYALFRLVEPGRAFGNPAVAAVFAHLVIASAGAFGVSRLAARSRAGAAVAVILLVASLAESRATIEEIEIPRGPEKAARVLAERAAEENAQAGAVLLPMGRIGDVDGEGREAQALWAAAAHGLPTPNGTTTTPVPFHESIAAHLARPRRGVADRLLRALGVRYVILEDDAGIDEAAARGILGGTTLLFSDGAAVLELDTTSAVDAGHVTMDDVVTAMQGARHRSLDRPGTGRIFAPGPRRFTAGQEIWDLEAVVENTGETAWCADGAIFGGTPHVSAGIRRWRPAPGDASADPSPVDYVGNPLTGRGRLPYDIAPGETAPVRIYGIAPMRPGRYLIELDLLVEGIAWFSSEDSPLAVVEAEVVP